MCEVNSLPVLYVRANSNYDVGYTIGKTFKSNIQTYCETSRQLRQYREFYTRDDGKSIVDNYMETSYKSHPNIMSEIRGIADGAGVKFDDIFLLQIASELGFYHIPAVMKGTGDKVPKGCTDLLLNMKDARIIGHNDDWKADVNEYVHIVHVTIDRNDGSEIDQFVSYCYPGYLPGFCFGMNKSLVISLNSLSPTEANQNSTPLLICLRSLLACHSIDQCVATMKNEPYGCAYGMNINIASINNADMCSMEILPIQGNTIVDVKNIPQEQNDESFYYHANIYRRMDATNAAWKVTGSKLREKRVAEMKSPKCLEDFRNILGDTADDKEPIYREPCPNHLSPESKTSATALFVINKRMLHVYRSNPKSATAPTVSLPFF